MFQYCKKKLSVVHCREINSMLGCDFPVVVIVISGQSMTALSRNKPVNTVLQAQIVVS